MLVFDSGFGLRVGDKGARDTFPYLEMTRISSR